MEPRRRRPGVGWAVLAPVLVVLTACSGPGTGASSEAAGPGVAVGPKGSLSAAILDVVGTTNNVVVSAQPLGSDLYRISAPAEPGLQPPVQVHGATVRVGQAAGGAPAVLSGLDIVVAEDVRWTINLEGEGNTETVNLQDGLLSALTLGAEVGVATAHLPAPVGTQTLSVTNEIGQVVVTAPSGPPAQVTAAGGAGEVTVDGVHHRGVTGESVFSEPGWTDAPDRYAIDLSAAVAEFTLTRS